MNRHEGVSCDACLKGNFRGRRYKCLVCFDYDLCAQCYEQGATTTRHTTDHPMQCILTRADFELYYGGEVITVDQPQSYTCPYCSRMGFTDTTLQEHVCAEHPDTSFEVVCPVCAAMIGGDPNMITDDLAGHLAVEHRTGGGTGSGGPRDLISFLDDPSATGAPASASSAAARHGMRRTTHGPRGVAGARARRSNMHFNSSGGLSSLSPSARDTVDPIAELLSQLSGVRRSAGSGIVATSSPHAPNNPTQLQQLQMQLQLERQQAARQQLERLPRRQTATSSLGSSTTTSAVPGGSSSNNAATGAVSVSVSGGSGGGPLPPSGISTIVSKQHANNTAPDSHQQQYNYQFLLASNIEEPLSEEEQEKLERLRANRSLFVQELLLATIASSSDIMKSSDNNLPRQASSKSSSSNNANANTAGAVNKINNTSTNKRINLSDLKPALPSTHTSNVIITAAAIAAQSTPAPTRSQGVRSRGRGHHRNQQQQQQQQQQLTAPPPSIQQEFGAATSGASANNTADTLKLANNTGATTQTTKINTKLKSHGVKSASSSNR
ncbi:E3 ubiquitin-protein ligase KCMF1-like isoform X2 [Chrysoperla carnea]|uniref:E3 ubiquitin-protein ligase KCMF1-like isoform X2 n=1 Tax=Chrysoperla carnea TaxID=189513 RepID=UPI001D075379|nr:E3 ubiquitin-protein ligase KCMF1-like isoform X2 [Chrysoperla carnea]